MEANKVYVTEDQIEGLAEIQAATAAWVNYHRAKARFENGDIDFEDVPAYNPNLLSDLRKKYPRAAVYLEAKRWIGTENPVKVRLGSRAMEKILNGEDPHAVLDEMNKGLDAFYMAQEG